MSYKKFSPSQEVTLVHIDNFRLVKWVFGKVKCHNASNCSKRIDNAAPPLVSENSA